MVATTRGDAGPPTLPIVPMISGASPQNSIFRLALAPLQRRLEGTVKCSGNRGNASCLDYTPEAFLSRGGAFTGKRLTPSKISAERKTKKEEQPTAADPNPSAGQHPCCSTRDAVAGEG